jgi:enoyl-CoA hydratase/carnithine racemase
LVLGEPELKFGAGIVVMILPWLVGPKLAKELIFTGADRIPAYDALRMGLINRFVSVIETRVRSHRARPTYRRDRSNAREAN